MGLVLSRFMNFGLDLELTLHLSIIFDVYYDTTPERARRQNMTSPTTMLNHCSHDTFRIRMVLIVKMKMEMKMKNRNGNGKKEKK